MCKQFSGFELFGLYVIRLFLFSELFSELLVIAVMFCVCVFSYGWSHVMGEGSKSICRSFWMLINGAVDTNCKGRKKGHPCSARSECLSKDAIIESRRGRLL